jgi:hypothetical protein
MCEEQNDPRIIASARGTYSSTAAPGRPILRSDRLCAPQTQPGGASPSRRRSPVPANSSRCEGPVESSGAAKTNRIVHTSKSSLAFRQQKYKWRARFRTELSSHCCPISGYARRRFSRLRAQSGRGARTPSTISPSVRIPHLSCTASSAQAWPRWASGRGSSRRHK